MTGARQELERVLRDDRAWLILVAFSGIVVLGINLCGFFSGITVVLSQLLYFPISLASYRFPRRGTAFAFALGLIYLFIAAATGNAGGSDAVPVIARVLVFVAIGWVIAHLSLQRKEQEERYRGLFDHSEAGTFLVRLEEGTPVIEEVNFRGAEILGSGTDGLAGQSLLPFWDEPENLGGFITCIRAKHSCYSYESRLIRKDGSRVDVILSAGGISANRFIVTVIDISEWRRADDAFRQANRELNFLSGIIRNDLLSVTSVIAGILKDGKEICQGADAQELIAKLAGPVRTVTRRLELTKDYQDLGTEEPAWQPVQEMVLGRAAEGKCRKVSIRVWAGRLEVYADRLIKNVFSHLLDNAVRHGQCTEIVVTYRITGDGAELIFEDNGRGILDEDKEAIFSPGHGNRAGLGLFIDREILGVTGITIRETGEPGCGARFEILIPAGAYRIV